MMHAGITLHPPMVSGYNDKNDQNLGNALANRSRQFSYLVSLTVEKQGSLII